MRDRNLRNRIHCAIRSVETGTPFARGQAGLGDNADTRRPLRYATKSDFLQTTLDEPTVVEGISRAWREREEILCENSDGLDPRPIEDEETDNPHDTIDLDPTGQKESTARAIRSKWLGLYSPDKDRGRRPGKAIRKVILRSFEGKRGNGRKSRRSTRESIRDLRNLAQEERLLAGELLYADSEARRERRRARNQHHADVYTFPTPKPATNDSVAA